MSMNSFDLHNPTSVREAISLLDAHDVNNRRIRILAGGQDLLTELKDRLVEPDTVVNLKHIPGLDRITYEHRISNSAMVQDIDKQLQDLAVARKDAENRYRAPNYVDALDARAKQLKAERARALQASADSGNVLTIGALVKAADVAESPIVRAHFPALAMAAESVASPQIRHAGTMGGNLCQRPRCWYYRNEQILCLKKGGDRCYAASGENKYNAILGGGPSYIVHPSDTATALVALDASVSIAGPRGNRVVPLEKFFILPTVNVRRENILKPDEIVTAILVPNSPIAARSVYLKFREKSSMDWAMSAAAVALHLHDGKVTQARIVLGGVAPIPWRAPKAEAALIGRAPTDAALHTVAEAALEGALALEHNGYKIPLTKTLVRRAIQQAVA